MYSADHLNYTPFAALEKLFRCGCHGSCSSGDRFRCQPSMFSIHGPCTGWGLELGMATNCCPGCWCTSSPHDISWPAGSTICLLPVRYRRHHLRQCMRTEAPAKDRFYRSRQAGETSMDIPTCEDIAYRLGDDPVETVIRRHTVTVQDKKIIL